MNKNNKQRLISVVAMMAATLIASGVLGMIAPAKPAHAAFPGSAGDIAFSSDRNGDFNIYRMGADGFGPTQLTPGSNNPSWWIGVEPAWSSNGTKIAYSYGTIGHSGLLTIGANGSQETPLTSSSTISDGQPSWFPGKNKVVFESDRTGGGDLYSITFTSNGTTSNLTRLTKGNSEETAPAVSPDGKKIAFASDRDGDMDIYVMKATSPESSTNKPVKLTKNSVYDNFPDWSPSGKKIAFQGYQKAYYYEHDIFVMNADGTNRTDLTNHIGTDGWPSFSPDGKNIAFASNRDGDFDVYRMRADGSKVVNLTKNSSYINDKDPAWQPLP